MTQKSADALTRSNPFKVPVKQWRKWDLKAKGTFNRLFDFMNRNPDLFAHPKAAKVERKYWKTVAWNAAWIAADIAHDKTILLRESYA